MEIRSTIDNVDKALQIAQKDYPSLRFVQDFHYKGRWITRVRLRLGSCADEGARRSASGRRLSSANWFVHKVFLAALFELDPETIVKTMLATYKGRADFEAKFLATGLAQVGSRANPKRFVEL